MNNSFEFKECRRMHAKVAHEFCGTHPQCVGCKEAPLGTVCRRDKWVNTWSCLSGSNVRGNFLRADEYHPSTDKM